MLLGSINNVVLHDNVMTGDFRGRLMERGWSCWVFVCLFCVFLSTSFWGSNDLHNTHTWRIGLKQRLITCFPVLKMNGDIVTWNVPLVSPFTLWKIRTTQKKNDTISRVKGRAAAQKPQLMSAESVDLKTSDLLLAVGKILICSTATFFFHFINFAFTRERGASLRF